MKDCFGHLNKNNYNVYIFKIKMKNGVFVEYDEAIDVSGFDNYEFLVKVNSKVTKVPLAALKETKSPRASQAQKSPRSPRPPKSPVRGDSVVENKIK